MDSKIYDTLHLRSAELVQEKIGEHVALYSQNSGAIVVTDDLGAAVLQGLQNAKSPTEIGSIIGQHLRDAFAPTESEAEEIGRAIIDGWNSAGLFNEAPAPFPKPISGHATPTDIKTLTYGSRYGRFAVDTDDGLLVKELDEILAHYVDASATDAVGDPFRCLREAEGDLALSYQNEPIWSRTDRDEARFLLLKEAAARICGTERVGAVLHGAAVCNDQGRAIVFIGDSGYGKSTLTQGLVARGCRFLADDHVPLALDGEAILAFPTAAAVKPDAVDLPEVQQLCAQYEMYQSTREGVSYLALPAATEAGTRHEIAAIVMPRYGEESEFTLEKLSPQAAFAACISSGARPNRDKPQIGSLARLCNTVPTYKLEYSSSEQSNQVCLDFLNP
ncbi:hypothetical protein [Roseovarius albus]|uniref:hypothetical protein n=1 Tax=Roseovarius albus TaxID=1247867 RepID=UPI00117B9668|nr:hypothetical protein [Roseovarius albus]